MATKKKVTPKKIVNEEPVTPPTDNTSDDTESKVFIESEVVDGSGQVIKPNDNSAADDDSKSEESTDDTVVAKDEVKTEEEPVTPPTDSKVIKTEAELLYDTCVKLNPPGAMYNNAAQLELMTKFSDGIVGFINTRKADMLKSFVTLIREGNSKSTTTFTSKYLNRELDVPVNQREYFRDSVKFAMRYLNKTVEEGGDPITSLSLFNGSLPTVINAKTVKLIKDRKF